MAICERYYDHAKHRESNYDSLMVMSSRCYEHGNARESNYDYLMVMSKRCYDHGNTGESNYDSLMAILWLCVSGVMTMLETVAKRYLASYSLSLKSFLLLQRFLCSKNSSLEPNIS